MKRMDFKNKYKLLKQFPQKSKLDQALWLIENYLPQKNNRASHKELKRNTIQEKKIIQNKRLLSANSRPIKSKPSNLIISLTLGNWALPLLKIFKLTGVLK